MVVAVNIDIIDYNIYVYSDHALFFEIIMWFSRGQ